jgi:hypothetical protein
MELWRRFRRRRKDLGAARSKYGVLRLRLQDDNEKQATTEADSLRE